MPAIPDVAMVVPARNSSPAGERSCAHHNVYLGVLVKALMGCQLLISGDLLTGRPLRRGGTVLWRGPSLVPGNIKNYCSGCTARLGNAPAHRASRLTDSHVRSPADQRVDSRTLASYLAPGLLPLVANSCPAQM